MEFAANANNDEAPPTETKSDASGAPASASTSSTQAAPPSIGGADATNTAAPLDSSAVATSEGDAAPTIKNEGTEELVDDAVDEMDKLKIHGGKTLNELHAIQSKRSHLSAGTNHSFNLLFQLFLILKSTIVCIIL